MVESCKKCKTPPSPHERVCAVCGNDVGFPNVRYAEMPKEREALDKRYQDAQKTAVARGITKEFQSFMDAAGQSRAVVNRHLGALNSWIERENPLFVSFHSQIESMGRLPTASNYDVQRGAAESVVNPFYYKEINYAALSLDSRGMRYYGDYCVVIKSQMIEDRSTVFEENPFEFNLKHHVIAGQLPPAGYRAVWIERGRLAATKLQHKIERGMQLLEYPTVLMDGRRDAADCDYVEVHIFGPVHRAAIEAVVGPEPAKRADKAVWRRTKKALLKLGVVVEETP